MKKLITLAVATFLLSAGIASAATISNPLFSNGDTTIDASGGAVVNGTFTLTVPAGEVVEWLRINSDTQPFTDVSVGNTLGYQEGVYFNVPFSAKVSPNTGNYNVYVQGAGTFGGNRSINGGDNVVVGATNVGMVRVVATGGSVGNPSTGGTDLTQLIALIAELQKQIAELKNPATPAPTSACVQLATYSSFSYGDRGEGVRAAQNYVMGHGGTIPAGATGFWGNQSANALISAKAANHCV